MKQPILRLALLCLLASYAHTTYAGLVELNFEGTFNRVLFGVGDVAVGDRFSGSFSYDEQTPLFQDISPGTRARYNTGAVSIVSGSNNYFANERPQLQIFNDFAVGSEIRDDFFLSAFIDDLVGPGFFLLQVSMIDITHSILTDLSIPSQEIVRQLGNNNLSVHLRRFESSDNELWQASAFGSSLVVKVDEPQSIALLATALFLLLFIRFLPTTRSSLI